MDRKEEVIDISKVVATPVLTGSNDNYIWTGVVKSKDINQYFVSNDAKREEFINLVKEYENAILEYKRNARSSESILQMKNRLEITMKNDIVQDRIVILASEIKRFLNDSKNNGLDMEMFWLRLARDYEEILENNPSEFDQMGKDARRSLEAFKKSIDRRDPCIREIYIPDENKYICYSFMTKAQEKRYSGGKESNADKLIKALKSISETNDLSSKKGIEILKELIMNVPLSDFASIFPNEMFAGMQYFTVFKNYLLKEGYTANDINSMSLEEIKDKALETYNSQSVEMHAMFLTDAIVTGIKNVDIEKLLLISMVRPILAYDNMSVKEDDADLKIPENIERKTKDSTSSDLNCVTDTNTSTEEDKTKVHEGYIQEEITLEDILQKMGRTEFIIKRILESGVISKKTKVTIPLNDDSTKEFSIKDIEKALKNYCDGIYLTDVIKKQLVFDAFAKEEGVNEWSDDLIKRLNLRDSDMLILSLSNFENFKRFYNCRKNR